MASHLIKSPLLLSEDEARAHYWMSEEFKSTLRSEPVVRSNHPSLFLSPLRYVPDVGQTNGRQDDWLLYNASATHQHGDDGNPASATRTVYIIDIHSAHSDAFDEIHRTGTDTYYFKKLSLGDSGQWKDSLTGETYRTALHALAARYFNHGVTPFKKVVHRRQPFAKIWDGAQFTVTWILKLFRSPAPKDALLSAAAYEPQDTFKTIYHEFVTEFIRVQSQRDAYFYWRMVDIVAYGLTFVYDLPKQLTGGADAAMVYEESAQRMLRLAKREVPLALTPYLNRDCVFVVMQYVFPVALPPLEERPAKRQKIEVIE